MIESPNIIVVYKHIDPGINFEFLKSDVPFLKTLKPLLVHPPLSLTFILPRQFIRASVFDTEISLIFNKKCKKIDKSLKGCDFLEVSGKQNTNVSETFDRLVDVVCQKMNETETLESEMVRQNQRNENQHLDEYDEGPKKDATPCSC